MKLFFIKALIFFIPFVVVLSYCFFSFIEGGDTSLLSDKLKEYQLEKIDSSSNIDTVFLGDSSLGNAIDANYFSERTKLNAINLALTGNFGYAGTYNLLIKTHLRNPTLKNVIIIHTLNLMTRDIAYEGYFSTIDKNKSILNSNFDLKFIINGIKPCIDLSTKGLHVKIYDYLTKNSSSSEVIFKDYIKQNKKISFIGTELGIKTESIVKNKTYFLVKIQEYALINNLNIIYLHGPQFENVVEESTDYIKAINDIITNTKIPLCPQPISMTYEELGDSDDHASPEIKKEMTDRYINLILSNPDFLKKLEISKTNSK